MEIAILKSNFNYQVPGRKGVYVDLNKTKAKNKIINSIKEGSGGVSGFPCLVSGRGIRLMYSEKLCSLYDPEWVMPDDFTQEEIEAEVII